jgi:fibronectin-binding autotransporter adhesin
MKFSSRLGQTAFERLESRITPASVVNFTDHNGDHVTFTSSLGNLADLITFRPAADGVHNVYSVNLNDGSFIGTNFSATVTKAGGGDGQLIVGHIDAGTNDLGKVSVAGDLGDIDAGSGSTTVAAIKSLIVGSMGRFGERGTGDNTSSINGSLPTLVVKGDIHDTYIHVSQTLTSATVGGSLVGGDDSFGGVIYAYELAKVAIAHDIRGGDGSYSGSVGTGHNAGSVTVGGSVIGGSGNNSGDIFGAYHADGKINQVSIGGSLIGGDGELSGTIGGEPASGGTHNVSLGTVTIGHDIIGGHGTEDAEVSADHGTLDQLTVKGSVIGGAGDYSGEIEADQAAGIISIGGSVYGGNGTSSAEIELKGGAKSLTIGGSLLGGKGVYSAEVDVDLVVAPLEQLKIGHDIRGGSGDSSAEVSGTITKISLGGNVIPGTGTDSGKIG